MITGHFCHDRVISLSKIPLYVLHFMFLNCVLLFILFKGVPSESSTSRVSDWLQGNVEEDSSTQLRVEYVHK